MTYLDYKLTREYMKENEPYLPTDKNTVKIIYDCYSCIAFRLAYYTGDLKIVLYQEFGLPIEKAIKKLKKALTIKRIF